MDVELDATEIAKLLGVAGVSLLNVTATNQSREQRVA